MITDIPMQGAFGAEDWILGNVQQYGYYRVNYNRDNWLKLVKQLKTEHKVSFSNQNTAAFFVVFFCCLSSPGCIQDCGS